MVGVGVGVNGLWNNLGFWMGEVGMLIRPGEGIAFVEFTRLCFVTSFHGLQERSFSEKSEMSLCEVREFFKRYEMIPHMNNFTPERIIWAGSRGRLSRKRRSQNGCVVNLSLTKEQASKIRAKVWHVLLDLNGFHVMIMLQLAPVAP